MDSNLTVTFEQRDLENHIAVAAFILDEVGRLLVLKHVKWGFWTIPVGKAEDGESAEEALRREVEEELGLTDFSVQELYSRRALYNHAGEEVQTTLVGYQLEDIKGEPQNKETNKHTDFGFQAIEDIMSKPHLSDQLILYLMKQGINHTHKLEGHLL